mgnify:CR=1 FL=1
MSTEPHATTAAPTSTSGFFSFFESLLSFVLCALMAIGLIAATATWRSSMVEFIGSDRMRITENTWWGLLSDETTYRSSASGWLVIRSNGDEVAVSTQPIRINN